ncbi:MAG: hypothetical protein Kow0088_11110 [Anaerolineales bacterium]
MKVERIIHGVPQWLLQEYLQSLGGEVSEKNIRGRGWEAWIEKIDPYRIGSLSVGRLKLVIEGEEKILTPLLEQLDWKTLRGGG